jgi:hypothetical protein
MYFKVDLLPQNLLRETEQVREKSQASAKAKPSSSVNSSGIFHSLLYRVWEITYNVIFRVRRIICWHLFCANDRLCIGQTRVLGRITVR